MQNRYLIFFFITINFQLSYSQQNTIQRDSICMVIDTLIDNDQKQRKLIPLPFFEILDSIYTSKGYSMLGDNPNLPRAGSLPKEIMLKNGKIAREIANKRPKFPKQKKDSLMKLQIILDNKNTEKLIEIIENIGFPNKNNCNCENIKYLFIFRHSQKKYWDKIRLLINKEYKENRLNEKMYHIYLDHINGRTGKDL